MPAAGPGAGTRPCGTLMGVAAQGDAGPPRCSPTSPILLLPYSTYSPNCGHLTFCINDGFVPILHHEPPSPCPAKAKQRSWEVQTPSTSMKSSSWLSDMNYSMIKRPIKGCFLEQMLPPWLISRIFPSLRGKINIIVWQTQ